MSYLRHFHHIKEGSDWQLAPAYDITFAHKPKDEWTSQYLMSVNGKYKNITADDIIPTADRFGVGEVKQLQNKTRDAIQLWPRFAKEAGLDKNEIERIKKLHITLAAS